MPSHRIGWKMHGPSHLLVHVGFHLVTADAEAFRIGEFEFTVKGIDKVPLLANFDEVLLDSHVQSDH